MTRRGRDNLLPVQRWVYRPNGVNLACGQLFPPQCRFMAGRLPPLFPEQPALLAHALAMLEEVPVGLLLLDAELRPLWFNAEAARACAVWNHGERRAAALRVRSAFRVPVP